MMKLILAEKPSVARDIAAVLGKVTRKQGYLEAGDYTITYAFGHLVGLADADAYDARYEKWRIEDLPILPDAFKLTALSQSKEQLNVIAGLLKQAHSVIVATDAGREGQLIYERIAQACHYTGPAQRLWLSSLTAEAIRDAFTKLRDNREYDPLRCAAESRSEADWLIGINATRCLTVRGGQKLPVGRVQTPTLAMIVARDLAIEHFHPVPYFELVATFSTVNGLYKGKWTKGHQTRFDDRAVAEEIQRKVQGKPAVVKHVQTKPTPEAAPQLFDLTALQRRANQLWGFTADRTLRIAQALYEQHKILTYPRTDSRYISQDIVPTLPARLKSAADAVPDLLPFLSTVADRPGTRVVNDAKVTDHHAILPTDKTPSSLTDEERQLYALVARQTVAALLPAAQWSITTIETQVQEELFRTTGRTLLSSGWRAAFGAVTTLSESEDKEEDAEEATSLLPPVKPGMLAQTTAVDVLDKETKAPLRYNEASLLQAMERAGREIEDEALAEAMKQRGLGTPATRAAIIEKLKKDGLLDTHKRQLLATQKGRDLIAAISIDVLKSPELTGEWEEKLKRMERNQYDRSQFMSEIREFTRAIVTQLFSIDLHIAAAPNDAIGACPKCGAALKETPKAFGCSAWKSGCDFKVWKEISGHKMTVPQVRDLVTKGITRPLKFKSKAGKPFEAQLRLLDGQLEFVFAKAKA